MSSLLIQNDFLQASVLPGIGAKIFDLIHRASGFNFLWHNPRIQPREYAIEANFDNYWCGGWDDAFPTCEACTYRGEQYPNLGELRSVKWTVEEQSADAVSLSAFGPISAVRARKTVRLNGPAIEMAYEVENLGPAAMDFLWGTHPAYAVSAATKLHVPARKGLVGVSTHPTLGVPGQNYEWPILGGEDISRVRGADANLACGHYASELSGGWYGVEHADRKQSLLFEFDLEMCPYLWMWLSYGGWRGYHLAVVEPWTSCPVTLSDAVEAGTHRRLESGAKFQTKVKATVGNVGTAIDNLILSANAAASR